MDLRFRMGWGFGGGFQSVAFKVLFVFWEETCIFSCFWIWNLVASMILVVDSLGG